MNEILDELRDFLDEHLPAFREQWPDASSWEARCAWQRILSTGGWAAPKWPVENGGRGLGTLEQLAIEDVVAEYGCPVVPGMLGLKNVGPTLLAYGTDEQKKHLKNILTTDEVWCQGFSEPGSGSDLASLRTRAVRDGDDFVVNGQKIWTSNGMYASHMELLVRTDPEAAATSKHAGMSVLLVEMTTPGIEVRPIRQINGGAEFAEVFFTDVRVPATQLLGPLNEGWKVTMTTLGHERAGVAIFAARLEKRVRELVAENNVNERKEALEPRVAEDLMDAYVEGRVLGMLGKQMLARLRDGEQPGPEQSVIKLVQSETSQRVDTLSLDIAGEEALDQAEGAARDYLSGRASTIAAGTTQIVKNIIAERVLGLPRA